MTFPDGCHRILLIDSYDSFTFNLAALIVHAIPSANVHIIRNDEFTISQLIPILPFFSAIVIGPGPGSPLNPKDAGVINELWLLDDAHLLPIFGVCLGLQSLAITCGATLRVLKDVKHGICSNIEHVGNGLYKDIIAATVVRYHSLHVDISNAPDLHRIAWTDDGPQNGVVTMAIEHRTKPFWAVQYHPESALSDESGLLIMKNFWRLSRAWASINSRKLPALGSEFASQFGFIWPRLQSVPISRPQSEEAILVSLRTLNQPVPALTSVDICDRLHLLQKSDDFVLLDSTKSPGQYSIIGCLSPKSLRISYWNSEEVVQLIRKDQTVTEPLRSVDIWTWVTNFMQKNKVIGGNNDIPFWGGLIGYITYEAGVTCMPHYKPFLSRKAHMTDPDLSMIFVDRSIVIDHQRQLLYLQSLLPEDEDWFANTIDCLMKDSVHKNMAHVPNKRTHTGSSHHICLPDKLDYVERVRLAKCYLQAGESYELCLTCRARVIVESSDNPEDQSWDLYKRLQYVNPAPYAAYLKLGGVTILSSSPERFLSYKRQPNVKYTLQPIKGTVSKYIKPTRQEAEKTLRNVKETSENLMIVDLIRHDLYGIVGDNVHVSQFCGIEEYETVWQSVSVIEGSPVTPNSETGWDVLKSCLPPGSMTGAPKKRSVEILEKLEDDERGVYSGVIGYWSVCGNGDWSVVIRSCVRYGNNDKTEDGQNGRRQDLDEWVIGAGGAVTALSDPESEWEEMMTKLSSVLRAFH